MNLYNNSLYNEDIEYIARLALPWDKLRGKKILISGATGLIGSVLVDVLMCVDLGCTIYAISRSEAKAKRRFSGWLGDERLKLLTVDINKPLLKDNIDTIDYVFHMASNTHPIQYATDPIGTITTNIIGLQNMLEFAVIHHASRFIFTSSNEIYGENRGDVDLFTEDYCGYINSNTIRAGYPESKRCGEALCQAYRAQRGLNIVIPRLTRSYGPTMNISDTKAISQFIRKGLIGEDIVLKSEGTQYYSYTYVSDAVSGILYVVLFGEDGEAYNIADEQSDITLRDLASIIADYEGRRVLYEIPDAVEAAGYSLVTKARLDATKLKRLGWLAKYDIKTGIARTLNILHQSSEEANVR